MYTNGYTGQRFISLITVTNAPKGYQVYTEAEFAAASEHITLSTGADADGNPEGSYMNHTECFGGTFTGV